MTASRILLIFFFGVICLESLHCATIPRNFDPRLNDEVLMNPLKKRPFCNAFTGCGRKRSQTPPGMPIQEIIRQKQFSDDDAINSILDSETTIEDISRQILTEAKLWEAIQEASAEIARRKQKDSSIAFGSQ